MRAWLVGKLGKGTREMSAVLNITRMHTVMTSVALWGRGLLISRAFARVRKVAGGRLLRDVDSHVRTMATNTIHYIAYVHLAFLCVHLVGVSRRTRGRLCGRHRLDRTTMTTTVP